MSQIVDDPFASADDPQIKTSFDYWAEVKVDSYFCVLVRGTGKVPFDASQHNIDQRRTAIDINLFPLAEQNIQFDVSRNMIAESREWAGIVLPSLKALNVSAHDINGKWAHIRTKETGETYTIRKGDRAGQTAQKTTFEFLAIYPDEAACRAAYQAASAGAGTQPQQQAAAPTPADANPEKSAAEKFLKVVVTNACRGQKDLNVIRNTVAANIAGMAPIAKWFTVDSPETVNLIMAEMTANANIPF